MKKARWRGASAVASLSLSVTLSPALLAEGRISVSAERLFGVQLTRRVVTNEGSARAEISTGFSLGQRATKGAFSTPRLGVDYVFSSGFSFGGGLFYDTAATYWANTGPTDYSGSGPESTRILLAPRAGYMLWLSKLLGIWPRVGLSYVRTAFTQNDDSSFEQFLTPDGFDASELALTIEAPLLFEVADQFWLQLSPSLDRGLVHSELPAPVEGWTGPVGEQGDVVNTDLGLHFALGGVF